MRIALPAAAGDDTSQRIRARFHFSLYELVTAVNEIADSEEEALDIVMEVLDSERLRLTRGVQGRSLHRF